MYRVLCWGERSVLTTRQAVSFDMLIELENNFCTLKKLMSYICLRNFSYAEKFPDIAANLQSKNHSC
jgi:hypothetical protein